MITCPKRTIAIVVQVLPHSAVIAKSTHLGLNRGFMRAATLRSGPVSVADGHNRGRRWMCVLSGEVGRQVLAAGWHAVVADMGLTQGQKVRITARSITALRDAPSSTAESSPVSPNDCCTAMCERTNLEP